MRKIGYFLIFLILLRNVPAKDKEEEKYERDEFVEPQECLKYVGLEKSSGLQSRLHFYNSCEYELYAVVCVKGDDGKLNIYRTRTQIPRFGHYYIRTNKFFMPSAVTWISGLSMPDLPEECRK